MAETHELQQDQIVPEGPETTDATGATETPADTPDKKPRAKRASVKGVEARVAALEQQSGALNAQAEALNQLTERIARFGDRIGRLEESSKTHAADGAASSNNGGDLAERVRQMEDRLQKLATILTQQTWGMPRV